MEEETKKNELSLDNALKEIIEYLKKNKSNSDLKRDISKALGDSVVKSIETQEYLKKIKSEYYTENNGYKKYNECAARGIDLIYGNKSDYNFFQDQTEGEINVKPPSFFANSDKKYTSKEIENHFNKYYMKNCLFCILGRHSLKEELNINSVKGEINKAIVQVKEMDKISEEDITLFKALQKEIKKYYNKNSFRRSYFDFGDSASRILVGDPMSVLAPIRSFVRYLRGREEPEVGNAKKRKLYYDELFNDSRDKKENEKRETVNFLLDEAEKQNIKDTFYYKYLSGQHAKIEHVGGKMKKKTKKSKKKNRKTRKRQRKSKRN